MAAPHTLQRLHKLIWVLIYGGLLTLVLGLATLGLGKMNKKAKVEAVRVMQERGLFIVKGGVEKAASALGVTRYTIYNYLEQLRGASQ